MATGRRICTMAQAYRDICAGEMPWVAIGNFTNEWFDYARDQRGELIAESLVLPEAPTAEQWRWAVFCAASVEWLCSRYEVVCPAWASNPTYTLAEPWYGFDMPGAYKPPVREHLIQTTPEPFRRRNIYCGNRVFANKYEFADHYKEDSLQR